MEEANWMNFVEVDGPTHKEYQILPTFIWVHITPQKEASYHNVSCNDILSAGVIRFSILSGWYKVTSFAVFRSYAGAS